MTSNPNELNSKYGFESPFNPDELSTQALLYITTGKKLLDIGCGEGADSVYYAERRFQVDAMDQKDIYLDPFRAYLKDHEGLNISIQKSNVINHPYPPNHYDAINCLLVGCCMRRSEFEKMLTSIKRTIKPGGVIIMSLRNYLDPELKEYQASAETIEPNSFVKPEDCCEIRYYIEKGRLKELFDDFEILYYYEGLRPDKYQEIAEHGDSCIICRRTE